MVKLRRGTQKALSETSSLRLRAAWLYYNQGLTQKDVAEKLGVSRMTIIRALDEAVKRGEVQLWINEGIGECVELAVKLEKTFGLDEAIVVPGADDTEGTAKAVGLALGQFLSEAITDDCTIGVGWGRTLTASLASFRPARRERVRVVSLLGGVLEAHLTNPIEFSWRLASQIGAECYLFLSPLLVDSIETKRHLIDRCGLDRLYRLAEDLDIAVISVGDISPSATSLSQTLISPQELNELVEAGCVGDAMCNFLDAEGRTVEHALNDRVMSIDLDAVSKARHVVLATGGASRAIAIRATMKRVGCNTLITDEAGAKALLALES
ncbi:sugar-binding transcriptional regulator [Kaistia granuli]|uniref:sugar-binding transcriptional regulator n=1 Tax=Kaistia granuli TaxID=363259 RepID=UPI00037D10FE|nr:sugar-binding transcriptional regulator [Kaistia granuli]